MNATNPATPLLSAVKAVVKELRRLEDKWASEYGGNPEATAYNDGRELAYGYAADLLDDAIKQASDHKQMGNE